MMLVSFNHGRQLRGCPCGHRYFIVTHIGYKWVRIKLSAGKKRGWRIPRKKWDAITELKDFKIEDENYNQKEI